MWGSCPGKGSFSSEHFKLCDCEIPICDAQCMTCLLEYLGVPGEGRLMQKRGQSRLVDSFEEGSWICISFPGSCCNKAAQAGMTENHGNGLPNSCRDLTPQTEALAEPAEGPSSGPLSPASWCCRPFWTSPGLWTHHFGLSSFTGPCSSLLSQQPPSSHDDTCRIGLGPVLMTSFRLDYVCKSYFQTFHIHRYQPG